MWRCIRHPDLLGIILVNSSVVRPSPCAFRSSSLPCVFMYGKSETRAHILYHIVLASTQDDVGYKHLRNWLSIEHHRFCDFPRTYLWPTRTCQNAKRSREVCQNALREWQNWCSRRWKPYGKSSYLGTWSTLLRRRFCN
jgi:hypothetical protein